MFDLRYQRSRIKADKFYSPDFYDYLYHSFSQEKVTAKEHREYSGIGIGVSWAFLPSAGSGPYWNPTTPGNLTNLQELIDTANQAENYTTDGAVNFVAANSQYLNNTSSAWTATTASPISISTWVTKTDSSAEYGLVAQSNGSGAFAGGLYLPTNGKARYTANGSGNTLDTATSIPVGTATHIVVTYDGTTCNFYVNGVKDVNSGALVNSGAAQGRVSIGARSSSGSEPLNGSVASTIIAQGIWTQADVNLLYAAGKGVLPQSVSSLGLSVAASNGYPFTNPTISAVGIGKDYIGSINLTPQAAPTYVAGKVSSTKPVNGDGIALIGDISGKGNNATQTTGANRYTYDTTDTIGGQPTLKPVGATSYYSITNVSLPTVFTVYGVTNFSSGKLWFCGGNGTHSQLGSDGSNTYFSNDAATTVSEAYAPSGKQAWRFRRDSNNICYFAATGETEQVVGPLSGTLTINSLLAAVTNGNYTGTSNQFALASLQTFDVGTNLNQDTNMRNYISSKYGVSLPAAVPFNFTPSQLTSAQFLLDNAAAGQQYTTDGAVSFLVASNQSLSSSTPWFTSGSFTASMWINDTDHAATRRFWGLNASGTLGTLRVFLGVNAPTPNLTISLNDGGTTFTSTATITDATNTHIVLSYDGATLNTYINGVLDAGASGATTFTAATLDTSWFGKARLTANSGINGSMSCLKIFSRAWSQAEVTKDYNSGLGVNATLPALTAAGISTTGAVAGYPCTNPTISATGIGKDYIGSNNLTPNNAPTYKAGPVTGTVLVSGDAVACPISQVATVTGGAVALASASSQNLICPSASGLPTGACTVSLWCNLTAVTGTQGLFYLSTGTATNCLDITISSSTLNCSSNGGTNVLTGGSPTANTNEHIVFVYDGANLSLYLNGSLVAGPSAVPSTIANANRITIGSSGNGFVFANGSMDAVGLFGVNLTGPQVTSLYNAGAGRNLASVIAAGLPTPVSYWDFDANNPLQLGLDSIGSNQLKPVNGPTITAGVVSPPVIGNNGYQATGANRFTLQTNQIGGKAALSCLGTSSLYNLLNTITATGVFTVYVVGLRTASGKTVSVFGKPSGGAFSAAYEMNANGNLYVQTDSAEIIANSYPYPTGVNGAVRVRRDASNKVWVASTGNAEIQVGAVTLVGNIVLTALFGINGSSAGQLVSLTSLQLADIVTSNPGQDASMRSYISTNYGGLTIP